MFFGIGIGNQGSRRNMVGSSVFCLLSLLLLLLSLFDAQVCRNALRRRRQGDTRDGRGRVAETAAPSCCEMLVIAAAVVGMLIAGLVAKGDSET